MIAFFIIFSLSDTIHFNVDPIVYRSTITFQDTVSQTTKKQDIFYLEFNCDIPYAELSYQTEDSVILATAVIEFKIKNLDKPDSLIDTLYRRFTLPSFARAAQEQISFIVQFGLHLAAGNYRYSINISSDKKQGIVEKELMINKNNYHMSDLLIAKEITIDTLNDYLRKGNLRVVPHPSHWFTDRYSTLYLYYEIYDLKPDSNKLKIVYKIMDQDNKPVRIIPQDIKKQFRSQAVNAGINIEQLVAGNYTLSVELDDSAGKAVFTKKTTFRITRTNKEPTIDLEEMPYYDKIGIFLSTVEYRAFEKMPQAGKKNYLKKFWAKRDYFEIAKRFEYAEKNYHQGSKKGYKTDRGRIYVKYGPPDEKEVSTIEIEESKPYEHWYYFNGYEFIFVDIRGTNEYSLVWTNVREEHSQPTLYKYLPEEIRREIE